MFCKSCDAVWFISERIDNYHKDPKTREEFIEDLRRKQLFTPQDIWKDGKAKEAKKLMILADQMAGFVLGFTRAEISELMARGYNLSGRNAKRDREHAEEQETALQAGRQEVDALHAKIREQTRAKLGHLGDGLDFRSYLGFDPTKTDTDEQSF